MIEKQPRRPIAGGEILPWAEDVNDTLRKARMSDAVRPSRKLRTSYRSRYHFQVEVVTATTVKVRAGQWIRLAADGVTAVPLSVDAGTSSDRDDFKTLTLSGSGTNYIVLTLNDALSPSTLTAISRRASRPAIRRARIASQRQSRILRLAAARPTGL